jgi:hypothetical protein
VALPLLFAALGCGDNGTVKGRVTLDGKPLEGGGVITLVPEAGQGGGGRDAPIDNDGNYKVEDVPVGRKRVILRPFPKQPPMPPAAGGTGGPPAPPNIPPRYNDPDTSGISLDVKAGIQDFPVTLTTPTAPK